MSKPITILKLLLYLVMVGFSLPAYTAPQKDRELIIRAAYLYNFTKFVIWSDAPESTTDNFTFCVVENEYFSNILIKIVNGRTIAGKNTRIRNISSNDSLSNCHLLYIHQDTPSLNSLYLKNIADTPSLTVGNAVAFNELGGIIRFYMKNNKLKFEINNVRALKSGLKIDSQLLRLGKRPNR
ncbi:MAG: YfiR family protein [Methylococcales bacterium]|nr:YfiR family protein [Methylococcales bacterium]